MERTKQQSVTKARQYFRDSGMCVEGSLFENPRCLCTTHIYVFFFALLFVRSTFTQTCDSRWITASDQCIIFSNVSFHKNIFERWYLCFIFYICRTPSSCSLFSNPRIRLIQQQKTFLSLVIFFFLLAMICLPSTSMIVPRLIKVCFEIRRRVISRVIICSATCS